MIYTQFTTCCLLIALLLPYEPARGQACSPVQVGESLRGYAVKSICTKYPLAYVGAHTLAVVDYSNPQAPVTIGETPTLGVVRGVTVEGGLAYLVRDSSLQIVDVSTPSQPVLRGEYAAATTLTGIAVNGTRAYLSASDDGLLIVDVSNPDAPSSLGSLNTEGIAMGVDVFGQVAFLAARTGGLQIVDVSDPESPALLATQVVNGWAMDVTVADGIAYVACFSRTLSRVDVTAPSKPVLLCGADADGGQSIGVAVHDAFAYVVDELYGLHVIGIKNNGCSKLLGSLQMPTVEGPFAVDVSGTRVLIGVRDGTDEGLLIVDASACSPCNASDLAQPFGSLDFSDVVYFLGAFVAQLSQADVAEPIGQWDFSDVVAFLAAFGAGCP